MKKITVLLLSFLSCLSFLPSVSHAASFDCNKAGTKVEKLICSTPSLSMMDESIARLYMTALEQQGDIIKQQQRAWLKRRNNQCGDAYYCEQVMAFRISQLLEQSRYTPKVLDLSEDMTEPKEDKTAQLTKIFNGQPNLSYQPWLRKPMTDISISAGTPRALVFDDTLYMYYTTLDDPKAKLMSLHEYNVWTKEDYVVVKNFKGDLRYMFDFSDSEPLIHVFDIDDTSHPKEYTPGSHVSTWTRSGQPQILGGIPLTGKPHKLLSSNKKYFAANQPYTKMLMLCQCDDIPYYFIDRLFKTLKQDDPEKGDGLNVVDSINDRVLQLPTIKSLNTKDKKWYVQQQMWGTDDKYLYFDAMTPPMDDDVWSLFENPTAAELGGIWRWNIADNKLEWIVAEEGAENPFVLNFNGEDYIFYVQAPNFESHRGQIMLAKRPSQQ